MRKGPHPYRLVVGPAASTFTSKENKNLFKGGGHSRKCIFFVLTNKKTNCVELRHHEKEMRAAEKLCT